MQRRIRLDNNALLRPAFQLFDQRRFPRLQRLRNFRMYPQSNAACGQIRSHLPRLSLYLVAQSRNRLHHPRPGAIRARLAQRALQSLLGPLARNRHQTKLVEPQHLRRRPVRPQSVFQNRHHLVPVPPLFHVDEIDDDDAAQIPQPHLPHDFLARFHVGAHDGVFQPVRPFAHEFPGVHVNRHQRLGVIDHDVPPGFQPDLRPQALVDFLLNPEFLEHRSVFGVQLHPPDQLRLKPAHEVHDLGVFLFGVHPDRAKIRRDVIAQNALHQIQIAMHQRRRFLLIRPRLDLRPGPRQEFHVRANFRRIRRRRRGPHDEPAARRALGVIHQMPQTRTLFGRRNLPRNAVVIQRRHVNQKTPRQSHVAGNPRALLAQRFLGNLHDDFLPLLQHVRDQLRASWR